MPIETYDDALRFWHGRTNYETLGMPQDLRTLKLERMRLLLEHLGRPQERFRIVHVAGTKGKGSTAALIASILQAAGLRTGLFTSPHLVQVEERAQIDGMPISREELTSAMQAVEVAVAQVEAAGEDPVTFFEIMTAVGLLHFARGGAEWAVLEVGLGGRFDATNVCVPAVSVITNISFDHMEQLGHTLGAIAAEKAGIIKPGVPVVSGVTAPEARDVNRRIATERQAPLFELERDFSVEHLPGEVAAERWPQVRFAEAGQPYTPWFELPLWGAPQAANAAVAWKTARLLREQGVALTEVHIAAGLRQVRWPARLEVLGRRPWVVLDCAHNDASFVALAAWLKAALPTRQRLLILALSRDKDLPNLVPLLAPHFDEAWLTRYASSSRGAEPERLAELWRAAGGGTHHVVANPTLAWQEAKRRAGPDDLICVAGSVFLAGELRDLIRSDLLRAQG